MNGRSQQRLLLRLTLIAANSANQIFSIDGLTRFSVSTLRLFRSLARLLTRSLAVFPSPFSSSMDDELFSSSSAADDNHLDLDLDSHRPSSSSALSAVPRLRNRSWLDNYYDDDDYDAEKLYLVPYSWWKEAGSVADREGGVLYNVSSEDDGDDSSGEIVLSLRKKKEVDSGPSEDGERGVVAGRQHALLSSGMWIRALKWRNDSEGVSTEVNGPFDSEDLVQDLFPLQIKLSVSPKTNSLLVKFSLKENLFHSYQRACDIFSLNSEPLHIWDFSGQTTQFLKNSRFDFPNGTLVQSSQEIQLELQVHGFSDKINEAERHKKLETSLGSGSVKMNGSIDSTSSYTKLIYSRSDRNHRRVIYLGLTGLQNLGNTCFMNSAIQCLAHTPKLVDYFLEDYKKEINRENPLGMQGELALAFGDLLRKLWAPGATSVAPGKFKLKLAKFVPQFSGYNQHDSQEILAFLLDGLHEDLNRVKHKPYKEIKDEEGRPHNEVAEEYWHNHLARNDSIIVDLFQGQYRSTLVCPHCKKLSVTFDPFMYLSLPLPSTTMRTMTLTVLSSDGIALPLPVTITVPKCGRLLNLIEALSIACSLRDDETLLLAEIYKNNIFRFLEDPNDALGLIRDDDKLVAYRLPKDNDGAPLVVFIHDRMEKPYEFERTIPIRKLFGIPLVVRLSDDLSTGYDLHEQFLRLLGPFLMPADDLIITGYDDVGLGAANKDTAMEEIHTPTISDSDTGSDAAAEDGQHFDTDFKYYLENNYRTEEIKMNGQLPFQRQNGRFDVRVYWSDNMIEKYDTCLLSSLPEVFKPQLYPRRPQESASLYKCLEAFLKEEPLGPEDMWYCPRCKKHRQASKKLDLWRLPEILVVHLKRFSYSRILRNKLETYVDYPIDDLDLSTYISHTDSQFSNRYVLYAISNHYGGMGSGHYTAFADLGHGRWFEFDDDRVFPVTEDRIKTPAAYVLFYRRVR